jgi:hypothetical protein
LTAEVVGNDVTVVVVLVWFTTCEKALEVAVAKFVSPLYVTVIECVPAVRSGTLQDGIVAVNGEPVVAVKVQSVAAPSR